jgi:iron complex transport system ATP-binding protein
MPEHVDAAARLRAKDLAVAYGQSKIIDGINLAIPNSAFTVLLGPNGSGKSTLLRSLAGLLPARNGAVLLDGKSISSHPTKVVAKHIGMLSQGPTAPDGLTVRGLVEQGRYPHRTLFGRWSEEDETACEEAMSLTGMSSLGGRLLDSLSGGQRQRAWIAMTLAQRTGTLLLDEPTTFLDLAHQIEILDLIVELVRNRGTTVVAVLHDLNQAARYADRIMLLKGGSIVSDGQPEAVLTAQAIVDVFEVDCRIIPDPVSGRPLCIPVAKAVATSD